MRDGLFQLKRKWFPLFLVGVALFGSGIALVALWLYRSSPYPRILVDFITFGSNDTLPRGTLISITAAIFAAIGGWILAFSIRKINSSEVGEIDSFWWKIAVASLAGGWWLGQPRVAVIGSGMGMPTLLRALKSFCETITVVVGTTTPELIVALADDEDGVKYVLNETAEGLNTSEVLRLTDGLRLHGRFLSPNSPIAFDIVTRADAVILCPDLDSNTDFKIGDYVRIARGKKILIGAVTAPTAESLAQAVKGCTEQCGSIHVLTNNNFVSPLPADRFYQKKENLLDIKSADLTERDLSDWSAPENWDMAKLSVFLREAITR